MFCYWSSSPQRRFAFSFIPTIIHGAGSGSNYNLAGRSWLLDKFLWISLPLPVTVCLYSGILQPSGQPSTFFVLLLGIKYSKLLKKLHFSPSWWFIQVHSPLQRSVHMALVCHESSQLQGDVPSTTPMGMLSVAAHGGFYLGISSAPTCVVSGKIYSSHPWEWHRNMARSGKEPVAGHGAQWWIQLSTRKAKWSPDYFWNHGSSQLRALFGTGCPLWNIPYSGMSNHGIHPPHTELPSSLLTRL